MPYIGYSYFSYCILALLETSMGLACVVPCCSLWFRYTRQIVRGRKMPDIESNLLSNSCCSRHLRGRSTSITANQEFAYKLCSRQEKINRFGTTIRLYYCPFQNQNGVCLRLALLSSLRSISSSKHVAAAVEVT